MPVSILPSVTGGAISRSSENILNAILAKRQRELQGRQLDIQDKDQALRSLGVIGEFLPDDFDAANSDLVTSLLERAAPDLPPGSFTGLTMNKQDFRGVVDSMYADRVRAAQESGEPMDEELKRMISVWGGLQGTTSEERDATSGATISGAEAETGRNEILIQAFSDFRQDDAIMENIARTAFGQDAKFSFEFGGETLEFDSNVAANMWLTLQGIGSQNFRAQLGADASNASINADFAQMVEERRISAIDSMKTIATELGAGLSDTDAGNIYDAYTISMDPGNTFAAGESPFEKMYAGYEADGNVDNMKIMDAMNETIRVGETNIFNVLQNSEGGRAALLGISLQAAISENIGKDVTPDQVSKIIDVIGPELGLSERRSGLGGMAGPRVFILGNTDKDLTVPGTGKSIINIEGIRESNPEMANKIIATQGLLEEGFSEAELIRAYGTEIVNMAITLSGGRGGN